MGCGSSAQARKAKNYNTGSLAEGGVDAKAMPCDLPSCASLADLLGPSLYSKSGGVQTLEAISGKGAVAFYFSAHWCGPCRKFTPQLAQWYMKSLKAKGLEVVFVSADQDAKSFNGYLKDMPWLAIPYADRARERALSKRFKVQGIPSLVILGPDGKVITKEGRAAVSSDPIGENFPWLPKSLDEVMTGATLLRKGGERVGIEVLKGKTYAFYFSAHWCPPCQMFTPKLAEWYSKSLNAKGLEIVFVSSDRDEESFKSYFWEMPWLALDFSDRKRADELESHFGIQGIPSLVIVGPNGETITTNGRAAVSADPEGNEFPWHRKPVEDVKNGPGSLQTSPTVLYFCEESAAATQQAALEIMKPLAQTFLDRQKQEGGDDPACRFMIATQKDDLSGRLRDLMSLPTDGRAPRLTLLDIADDGAFYEGPQGDLTVEALTTFVTDFEKKNLVRKQLKRN